MEVVRMDYSVGEKGNRRYIECLVDQKCIENERDALDLVVACIENDSNLLLLYEGNLSPGFFELSTGLAGNILQKFVNYSIKVAAVIDTERISQGRFREMVIEVNQGSHFRVFNNCIEAVEWLVCQD
jgi:PadR family transcriptional regulator AphA